ncbi:MAG: acetyl-CoA hydrolase/transferase C-terminal domain-containing protein [Parvibaculum sedimenti]|uniref:acetyl-CoA hydrolase/transferase C-terminal domain-containing protein n=1 Tax=Parvibaculum sedimenti TaxID=2608632 RepID=UPI003BB6043A
MSDAPIPFAEPDAIADAIIAKVGKKIVLALPLGLGKANHIANALFARAAADPSITLQIITALTLEKPHAAKGLEGRFMNPIVERLFEGYPELAYAKALRAGTLPPNIEVSEFFFVAGRWLGVPKAQQNYISTNYTHAQRYILARRPNVIAQLVARHPDGTRYSISSNTDLTLDMLAAREAGKADFILVGEVNSELPYIGDDAEIPASTFSLMLESAATDFPLFAPPKEPVSIQDYAVGLHVARMVPDGGTLQIGIGSMGDAIARGLILRDDDNETFRAATQQLALDGLPEDQSHLAPFDKGLFGSSEMLVDTFLELMDTGIIKREVDGTLLHGGFFLGPRSFYKRLRELPEAERAKIRMKPISYVNELYGDEETKRKARVGARFVNSAMMVTLLGAVASDALEDGRVVSGVGGQYNFVAQAFALEDARSIITLRATRQNGARTLSNIRWSYGHTTIPRHLRDIVVTEYGIADLRGKSDRDCIAAMLEIADSRFQAELLASAKKTGKIEASYEIPAPFRNNTPRRVEIALAALRDDGLLDPFPFGTDFTETELRLLPALQLMQTAAKSPAKLGSLFLRGLSTPASAADRECLARMALENPRSLSDRLYASLLRGALRA